MYKKTSEIIKNGFIYSILLHLLFFSSFFVIAVHPIKQREKPPGLFVPSYIYQKQTSELTVPKQDLIKQKSPKGIEKPKLSTNQTALHPASVKTTKFDKQSKMLEISKPTAEEPIHLIGENKIVKPLIKLIGQALTAHLVYPKIAIDFFIRGIVYVGFLLHPDGTITDVKLLQSSGAGVLDEAALTAINAISPLKNTDQYLPAPDFLTIAIIFG